MVSIVSFHFFLAPSLLRPILHEGSVSVLGSPEVTAPCPHSLSGAWDWLEMPLSFRGGAHLGLLKGVKASQTFQSSFSSELSSRSQQWQGISLYSDLPGPPVLQGIFLTILTFLLEVAKRNGY